MRHRRPEHPSRSLGSIGTMRRRDGAICQRRVVSRKRLADVDTILLDKTGNSDVSVLPRLQRFAPSGDASRPQSCSKRPAIAENLNPSIPWQKAILKQKRCNSACTSANRITLPTRPGRGVVALSGSQRIVVGNWIHLEQEGVVSSETQKRRLGRSGACCTGMGGLPRFDPRRGPHTPGSKERYPGS